MVDRVSLWIAKPSLVFILIPDFVPGSVEVQFWGSTSRMLSSSARGDLLSPEVVGSLATKIRNSSRWCKFARIAVLARPRAVSAGLASSVREGPSCVLEREHDSNLGFLEPWIWGCVLSHGSLRGF